MRSFQEEPASLGASRADPRSKDGAALAISEIRNRRVDQFQNGELSAARIGWPRSRGWDTLDMSHPFPQQEKFHEADSVSRRFVTAL